MEIIEDDLTVVIVRLSREEFEKHFPETDST